ncbi:MAG: hypothetical protein JOZ81_12480 [Chloroflexi bacterium]|nr:hypothetical protein [Chloroflexota bacterium]
MLVVSLSFLVAAASASEAGPTITSVSPILPPATQTITISESGSGSHQPYNGDSYFIEIKDVTKNWEAGYCLPSVNPPGNPNSCVALLSNSDAVGLNIASWTDTTIQISVLDGSTWAYSPSVRGKRAP